MLISTHAFALTLEATLPTPAEEARAKALFRQVRCLVCQGESINESLAPLASDMRGFIRDQIREGKTDAEILEYLAGHYGQEVLFDPGGTAFLPLWLLPLLVLAAGGIVLAAHRTQSKE